MALTAEELNTQFNEQLQTAIQGVLGSIKTYVDGKDAVQAKDIKNLVLKELTDVEGLATQLDKIQKLADAFASVFDSDNDGKITPEEILAKITLLQSAIDGVNGRVDAIVTQVTDFKSLFDKYVDETTAVIDTINGKLVTLGGDIARVQDALVNYYTKDEVNKILAIDADALKTKADDIFVIA